MKEVIMPRLDEVQEKGMVAEWLKVEGDKVTQGEEIVEVMTEKVSFPIESPTTGILRRTFFEEGDDVPIGTTIAIISETEDSPAMLEEAIREIEERLKQPEVPLLTKEEIIVTEKKQEVITGLERVKISPIAKKLAKQHKLDTTKIQGTGPGGRIIKEDILWVIKQIRRKEVMPEVISGEKAEKVTLTGVRKIIADRVTQSYRTAPHVTVMMEVDASHMVKLREEFNEKTRAKLSYNAILIKASAEALQTYKIFNSIIEESEIRINNNINVGLAVAIEDGSLIVPVIPNADKKSLKELNTTIDNLADKARHNKLSLSEVKGSTFCISNLGMYEIDGFTPILPPKQTAILGVGAIAKKPRVINEKIVIRPMVTLSLSFDHRVVDGALAAQFLRHIKDILETFTPVF
ncbi:MAG: dihydrolipoamide acetyltransferase family protein [Candidatus Hodarchaeota archaeon]